MSKLKKNPAESIRQKLKNLSLKKNRPFDEILRYYAMERFLYRLSMSAYKDRFFLKGALLFRVWDQESHRPTMDIDFLARVSNHFGHLEKVLKEISEVEEQNDAISFSTNNLILKEMQTSGEYSGVRASFCAQLFRTTIPMLVDIGFNDEMFPKPQEICYPTLLSMGKPILKGYTPETVIAEKLETIIKFGTLGTRIKDFYDIWQIFQLEKITSERKDLLQQAIQKVFLKRKTSLKVSSLFSPDFFQNKDLNRRWQAFLQTMDLKGISFEKVIAEIKHCLDPVLPS